MTLKLITETGRKTSDGHKIGKFLCHCGEVKEISISRVKNGYTKSCGCLKSEFKNITHGMKGSATYSSWSAMKNRCTCKTSKDYKKYGEVGIRLSESWLIFENFYKDMGSKPDGMSIDRIDNTKGYSKENCKWSTHSEQQRNKSSSFDWFIKGVKFNTCYEAAIHFNVKPQTIIKWCKGWFDKRINKQWSARNDCYRISRY